MKPVKLEIITEAKGDGFSDVSNDLKKAKKDIETLIGVQKQYIENIRGDLARLKKEFARSNDANAMKPLAASISELESELKDAEFALALLEKTMAEGGNSSKTLRTQIRELENEMANMTEGTEEYIRAMERLGELRDRQGDISQQGRIHGDDEKNIRATADAIAGLSGAMSAGVGIASLFGAEQEKLQQIQTRLQAVMATTIGLQQVAQTLNKDSYFSQVLLTGVKKKWASAQALLNTQLGIGVGLSKALMVSGIGLLLAGIAALVAVYNNWKKKQAEINALKQQFIDLEVDTAKALAKSKVETEQLHKIAKDQTKDYEVREKAIRRLKALMPEYNGYINREGVLVDNANVALKNYLVTLYKVEKAKKILSSIEDDQGALDAMKKKGSESLSFMERMWIGLNRTFDPKSGDKVMGELIAKKSKQWVDGMNKLGDSIKEKNKSFEELISDKTIFDAIFGDDKKSTPSATVTSLPDNKLAEQRLAAYRKIKEMEIALMEDGEKKRKAQAELEFKNKIDEIAREKAEREKHLKELAKAKIPVSQEEVAAISTQAQEQALLAKEQYEQKIRQIDRETAENYKAVQNEVRQNFATRLERQLADIDDYYAKMRERARGNLALVGQIELARIQARKQATHEAQLHEIELETELALRKQEIDDRQVLLAADRQEKLLQIELAGAQKRLAKLEQMQKDGMETADDIALVRSEIEKLTAAIKKIPTDRLREIGGHLKSWLSALSGIGGELGETFSALAGGVDDVLASFDKEASTLDKVGAGINGLVKLYSIAANQLEENKRKQQEWNDKIEESVHIARMMRIEEKSYKEANIFGVENPYEKAISGANQYREAMKALNESLNKLAQGQVQIGTKKVVSGKNVAGGVAGGAAVGAAVGSFIPVVGNALGAVIGGVLGGIFGATRKKIVPVFNSLTREFGSILKSGTETFELNPKILENYSKLDESTKKLVDNWETIRKKALEAQEQMRQSFKDLAGDIGSSLSSALVESFRNNELYSAVDKFHDKITETIEKILEQLVFSAHFKKLFDELQERFEDSIDGGDGDIVDDIIWFTGAYKDKIAEYGKHMEQMREEMKRQGFDVFGPLGGNRSAAAKGIAQASQDSIDETNGRLTNIQGSLLVISERTVHIADLLFSIFAPLNRIADNTDRLEAIEMATIKTREILEKMDRDGLNVKR